MSALIARRKVRIDRICALLVCTLPLFFFVALTRFPTESSGAIGPCGFSTRSCTYHALLSFSDFV
jgi:hypothetical protein